MVKNNSKAVYLVALVLLLGGLGYLLVSGISQGSTPTLQVAEAQDMAPTELAKVRLYGKVAAEGIAPHEDGLGVDFNVLDQADPSRSMRVAFRGAVPDTFEAGVEVIVKGSWDPAAQLFRAGQLTTKCPSKYEEKREEG